MGKITEKLKKILYTCLGEKLYYKLLRLRTRAFNADEMEHYESYGELNQDKTIYLIRKPHSTGEGLLSLFVYAMARIDFADRNGMIPFVDLDKEGVPSRFNRYFNLKSNLTKEEVFQSKTVLLSGEGEKPVYPGWCNWINTEFNEQKNALFEKYVEFTDEVKKSVEKGNKKIQPEKCLGLYLRGTDYISLKPGGHPIQPTLEDVAQQIDAILQEEQLENIFLVTEDIRVYEQVKGRYGEKVVILDENEFLTNYKDGEMVLEAVARKGSVEEMNLLYLTKIILLSQCHSFVGGRTNGSSVANAFNGGRYKRRFVYDIGYYE